MEHEGWRDVHIGFEGDELEIGGVKIWQVPWRSMGQHAMLPHPAYPKQRHRLDVYEAGDAANPIRFATGELSNGVWGFFVPV